MEKLQDPNFAEVVIATVREKLAALNLVERDLENPRGNIRGVNINSPRGEGKKAYQLLKTLIKTDQQKTSVIEYSNIHFLTESNLVLNL